MHYHNYLLIILVLCATPLTAMESKSMIGESTKCDHLNDKEICALEVREEKKILRLEDGDVELLTSMAIRCLNGNIVLKLLNQGADIRRVDKNGNTMLHYAVKGGFGDIIPLLLERGVDINQPNNIGETPLMMAYRKNNFSLARELIKNGANIKIADENDGNTILHYAVKDGHGDIIPLLLEKEADINQPNNKGETPLKIAIKKKNFAIARELIENGVDMIDISAEDTEDGCTPLHWAARYGCIEIIPLLIKMLGARVDQQNKKGETPLIMAIENKNYVTAERLIQNGADVNLMANSGSTPLHCAVYGGSLIIIKLLLEKGADPLVQETTSNETPAEIAWRMREGDLAMKIESFIEKKYSQEVLKSRGYVAHRPPHWYPRTF